MKKITAVAYYHRESGIVIIRPSFTSHVAVHDGIQILDIDTSRGTWQRGFLTNEGVFVDRHEAMTIARNADQVKDVSDEDTELFSDNLK